MLGKLNKSLSGKRLNVVTCSVLALEETRKVLEGASNMTFEKAVATVRTSQLVQEDTNEALSVLLDEGMRMRKALQFYASRDSYIDGVPMLKDPETGLLATDDEGAMARAALRLTDVSLGIVVPQPEANAAA